MTVLAGARGSRPERQEADSEVPLKVGAGASRQRKGCRHDCGCHFDALPAAIPVAHGTQRSEGGALRTGKTVEDQQQRSCEGRREV